MSNSSTPKNSIRELNQIQICGIGLERCPNNIFTNPRVWRRPRDQSFDFWKKFENLRQWSKFKRKSGIFTLKAKSWLHRSPTFWFCGGSIILIILHLQLTGFVKIWRSGDSVTKQTFIFSRNSKKYSNFAWFWSFPGNP